MCACGRLKAVNDKQVHIPHGTGKITPACRHFSGEALFDALLDQSTVGFRLYFFFLSSSTTFISPRPYECYGARRHVLL